MSSPETDPQLIAHRKLVEALPDLLDAPAMTAICAWLEARQVLHDGQEDPGAVMVEGLETELAIAGTFRKIAEGLGCQKIG